LHAPGLVWQGYVSFATPFLMCPCSKFVEVVYGYDLHKFRPNLKLDKISKQDLDIQTTNFETLLSLLEMVSSSFILIDFYQH
jgi:hypothetical protein